MRLKDNLILREVAGQYVIVPVGKRVREVTSIVYISSSARYLWDYMKDKEFEEKDLISWAMGFFTDAKEEKVTSDIREFLEMLDKNNILENKTVQGWNFMRFEKEKNT